MRETHVNLVDLIDSPTTGKAPALFDSEEALSEYTIRTGKYFPKKAAKAGGVLRYLLRQIDDPSSSSRSRTSEGRNGRGRGRGRA